MDRREELKHVPWRQGSVETMPGAAQLKRAPASFQAQCAAAASCMALASAKPGGFPYVVFTFDTADECAAAVEAHNRAVLGKA